MAQIWNQDAVQVTVEGRLNQQLYINRWYVAKRDRTTPWTQAQVVEAGNKAAAFWELDLLPLLSNTLFINEIRTRVMAPNVALQSILPVVLQGGDVNEPVPNNVALCVTLSTGFAGRAARGRMYLGGIPGQRVVINEITTAYAELVNDAFQAGLISRYANTGTTDMDVVIYSQFEDNQLRDQARLTVVTEAAVRDRTVDSQRRRLPGRGR